MNSGITSIPFVKACACGNDFLLIDAASIDDELTATQLASISQRICDRHNGVGADGVEWMYPHATADVEIRLINNDGSEAEISGNGTRCVAAYLCAERKKEKLAIQTGAGLKICTLTGKTDSSYEFEAQMGEAVIAAELALTLEADKPGGDKPEKDKVKKRRGPGHSGFHGKSPLCRFPSRVPSQLAGTGGLHPAQLAISPWRKRGNSGCQWEARYRGSLFRARRGRDAIIGNRFVRIRSRVHRYGSSRDASACAHSRRHANHTHGRKAGFSSRFGTAGLPGRVFSDLESPGGGALEASIALHAILENGFLSKCLP